MSASSFGESSKTSYNDSHSSGTVQPFNFNLPAYPPFSPTLSSTIANSPTHQFCFTLYSTQSKNNQNEICQFFSIFLIFFFYLGFLLRILTIHWAAREGRGPFFVLLYHFHPLTNIQIFNCNFACEMTIT